MLKYILITLYFLGILGQITVLRCDEGAVFYNNHCIPYQSNNYSCEQLLNEKCILCRQGYRLQQEIGVCMSQKIISDYETDALDIGQPLVDKVDSLQQLYGSGSKGSHSFNLKNHPELVSANIISGFSYIGVLGIYNLLFYQLLQEAEKSQISIITHTDCSGKIFQVVFKINEFSFAKIFQILVNGYPSQTLFSIQRTLPPYLILNYQTETSIIHSVTLSLTDPDFIQQKYKSPHELLIPKIVDSLLQQNISFNPYLPKTITNHKKYVIIDYGVASVSAVLDGCQIKVNKVVYGDDSYNKDLNFFDAYIEAQQTSLINNLPAINRVQTNKMPNSINYNIFYQILNPKTGQLIDFKTNLIVMDNQRAYFDDYNINGESITNEIKNKTSEIEQSKKQEIYFQFLLLCQEFEDLEQCSSCIDGFKVMEGQCVNEECIRQQEGSCRECIAGFQARSGFCVKKDPHCREYFDGKCVDCQNGFTLIQQKCIQSPLSCPFRYYPKNGICQPVNFLCNLYDLQTGHCLTCYQGYKLYNTTCIDIDCETISNNECIQCKQSYFLRDKVCVKVDFQCKTYQHSTGKCTSCFQRYFLTENGTCLPQRQQCSKKINGECVQCPIGKYLFEGMCLLIDQACSQYYQGVCYACFAGYQLINGTCIDSKCVSSIGYYCLQCIDRYYPKNGVCVQVNYLCNTYDKYTGKCTSCYPAFKLRSNGYCYLFSAEEIINDNCQNYSQGKCINCEHGYGLTPQGLCLPVSHSCKTIINGLCLSCPTRFFFYLGSCFPVDRLCLDYNTISGQCLSCYNQYRLVDGKCVDVNCLKNDGEMCLKCAQRYYNKNGLCIKINSLCETYDELTGRCRSCYIDYILQENGLCELA